ncbi:methyltransferase domain-containing protein [Altererythrobacter marinus]|jgi:ubiquinone/menaquinone biosynthesis C-methylase UbiE|uniref:Methyltransferase domain-containing protein n=1 Tax=Pelagerythrobacter marinus TaxID=538382 RepID=A0ABW9UV06_9SPHN|nr:methyltransferase domain-containing protein [Pelagerythrobacter marinus]MXO67665.1 methyltransferase domain-containing protein [Pelagerythrobacter marinus]
MRKLLPLLCGATLLALAGCEPVDSDRPETAQPFPTPDRPVSELGGNQFSTETARDSVGEARKVMDLAEISPGMSVADIGAGEGYYTVRLAGRVGEDGRVLAQDIDREALDRLALRVERQRLDNVSIKLGAGDDPKLPPASFDRVFMVHMYHEVREPYAFLWRLWPALREGGRVIVVDVNRPADQHGIEPLLLACEFKAVGFELDTFHDAPELAGYYAQFKRAAKRPEPEEIKPCRGSAGQGNGNAAR